MPSQEEYLDNLLKDVMHGDETSGEGAGEKAAPSFSADNKGEAKENYLIQDTADMSVEDIDRILAENETKAKAGKEEPVKAHVDLEQLLDEAEEAKLNDIKDLLHKADQNEAVNEDIIALLEHAQDQNREIEWNEITEEENAENKPKEAKGFGKKLAERLKARKEAKARKNAGKKKKDKSVADDREKNKIDDASDEMMEAEVSELFGQMHLAGNMKTDAALGQKEVPDRSKEPVEEQFLPVEEPGQSELDEIRDMSGETGGKNSGSSQGIEELPIESDGEDELSLIRDMDEGSAAGNTGIGDDVIPEMAGLEDSELSQIMDKNEEAPEEDIFEQLGEMEDIGELESLGQLQELGMLGDGSDLEELADIKEKSTKKKGFFAKLLDLLTEEDEEEGTEESGLILSEENEAILKELDQEKGTKKKGKKEKKKKGKGEASEDEVMPEKKEKKPKKPKKVKEPKLKEPEEPGKKLSKRRVLLIFLICISIGAVILLLGTVSIDFSDKRKASKAYSQGDYETCYENLVGKRLNGNQQIMFGKSKSILSMRLWIREYEMLAEQGQEPEALDSLMQSVHDYPKLYNYSDQWNATSEVQEIYGQMLNILLEKYHLTEEEAKQIANEPDDLIYSKTVRWIAGGGTYAEWIRMSEEKTEESEQGLTSDRDVLPEEDELSEIRFAD